jgi:hypothetical protein
MGKTESDVMLLGTIWMSIEKLDFLAFGGDSFRQALVALSHAPFCSLAKLDFFLLFSLSFFSLKGLAPICQHVRTTKVWWRRTERG